MFRPHAPTISFRNCRLWGFVLVVSLFAGSPARADIMLVPPGLNPGDQFRIIFVSSASRDATSANIADYDQFITNLAVAAGLDTYFGSPVTWQALGSTPTVSAISRLPATSPGLYLLTGVKVADDGADLWDGLLFPTTAIDAPININELGALAAGSPVWTGTRPDGSIPPAGLGRPLGDPIGSTFGLNNTVAKNWVEQAEDFANVAYPLYGYSSVLTVPQQVAAIPEPASLAVIGTGLALLGLRLRGRRKAVPR